MTKVGVTGCLGRMGQLLVNEVENADDLDFAGGIGTLAVGHCPPNVVDAIQSQAEKLIHMCSIVSSYESMVELAELLNQVTLGDFAKKTTISNTKTNKINRCYSILAK